MVDRAVNQILTQAIGNLACGVRWNMEAQACSIVVQVWESRRESSGVEEYARLPLARKECSLEYKHSGFGVDA